MPTSSSPSLLDLAHDAFAYLGPDFPGYEWERSDEVVLRWSEVPHPLFNMVLRPRARDVDATLDRARAWFRERDRSAYSWWISDAAEPPDLIAQLLARGLVPDELDGEATGMVLTREPAPVDGIDVHPVESYEEALAASEVGWRSFEFTAEQIAERRREHRKRWDEQPIPDDHDLFVALRDGVVVGSGHADYAASGVYLASGNVAEEHRGHGVYRALVRARWDEAVRRGTPALVVQAGKMSRPILERLGFEPVCRIDILIDDLG